MHNNIKITSLLIAIFFVTFLVSCATPEKLIYFQGDEQALQSINKYTPTLQPDDLLVITVSPTDERATLPFNQVNQYSTRLDESRRITYLIDEEGYINYPELGKIKLGGLTRTEAMEFMKEKLKKYIVSPGVNIQIINFRITVLGEVEKPGTFTLPNERVTILEALGMAGDLTINGVRKNVLVVREENGEKTMNRVDLTSNSILNSPVYYLKQNDVVYVEPNKAQINSSTYSRNTSVLISVAGLLVTVISVLTR